MSLRRPTPLGTHTHALKQHPMNVVQAGDSIIVREPNAGCGLVVEIPLEDDAHINYGRRNHHCSPRCFKYGKYQIPWSILIGLPFGTTLRLETDKDGKQVFVKRKKTTQDSLVRSVLEAVGQQGDEGEEYTKRRRLSINDVGISSPDVTDTNTSQSLTPDDISQLKRANASGVDLVSNLVTNSTSFTKRNALSQEKYIRRKLAKHIFELEVLEANMYNVIQAYGGRDPFKIGGLRYEHLGSMLIHANVHYGCQTLVFDHSMGILTAAAISRMGGGGSLYHMSGRRTANHVAQQLKFSSEEKSVEKIVPFELVLESSRMTDEECLALLDTHDFLKELEVDPAAHVLNDENSSLEDKERARLAIDKRTKSINMRRDAWRQLIYRKVDSFMVSINPEKVLARNPTRVVQLLTDIMTIAYKFLNPAGRLVVFCPQMQPLADCFAEIRDLPRQWIQTKFEEIFIRPMSMLPHRSHPVMDSQISLFGGFIMSTTKVQ